MEDNLKQFCKDIESVAEYFLVIGLDSQTIENHHTPQNDLSPILLCQFPPFIRPKLQLPDSIETVSSIQFIAPLGLGLSDRLQGPKSYSVILTSESGAKVYCTCLLIYEPYNSSQSTSTNLQGLFIPKILTIVSSKPFFSKFKQVLKNIYSLQKQPELPYPLQLYIAHFLFQVPMPSKGLVQVILQLTNQPISFAIPASNRLPLLDVNLSCIFNRLDFDNFFAVFRHLSLQQSVVFLSQKQSRLFACSYTMLSFLYPFVWTLVYVPILPTHMLDYLYSPVNFVYGIHKSYKEDVQSICGESALIVDLDANKIVNKRKNDQGMNEHYMKKLYKKIKALIKKKGTRMNKLHDQKLDQTNIRYIRDYFFQYYVSILLNYKRFMNYNHKQQTSIFDKEAFLETFTDLARPYMSELLKTQMFANFCEERVYPPSVDQHCENLFLDESIIAKENRSALKRHINSTPFLDDISQRHSQKYTVPAIDQTPSSYGYQNFPILNLESIKEFDILSRLPPSFENYRDMPEVQIRIASQVPKGERHCIYLCWFEMWAASLWYQESIEISERLGEALNSLQEVSSLPNSMLTPIFKRLLQAASRVSDSLVIPIYEYMTSSGILLDASTIQILHRTLSARHRSQGEIIMRNTGNSLQLSARPQNMMATEAFIRNRIFMLEEVKFSVNETCPNCNSKLAEQEIHKSWREEMDFGCACYFCEEYIFPKLHLHIPGRDLIEEDNLIISPQSLLSLVNSLVTEQDRLEVGLLRTYNALIFWNLGYYFLRHELPSKMIVPYVGDDSTN